MTLEIIPPTDDPPPAVRTEPTTRTTPLCCGFCDSSLTSSGEVLKLSARAKKLRDFEDDVEDLKRELAECQEKATRLQADLDEARRALDKKAAPVTW